ncbi:phosphoenolpyruvate carboxylase [Roseomonas marmotae]|uniref:Phosphoenolpyruvate carboxylase n=1 Tax=Roseomonas marmotae TaxID=2768161 RepID=A0ABS3KJ57_9PROT|nr:phosphoenolpyruvate carboxylase [Roseomonas marmotae]MBO1076371.1 phosphoenolpyruvate carboxylase [Roseomonas marmotae]QTI79419.1 phosphoenolpyruvate carboxylase [Roseomonas marmotae]
MTGETPESQLLSLTEAARAAAGQDPFARPALSTALALSRRMDEGQLNLEGVAGIISALGRAAFLDRAAGLARKVGLDAALPADAALARLAARAARPDPADSPVPLARFRAVCEHPRAGAVFTAHPTFSLPRATGLALARAASGMAPPWPLPLRPVPPTLEEEFEQAAVAIAHGRDALDRLAAAFLATAREIWPDRWTVLDPRPVILASWVGYDTDGRTDIGWQDTLRLRLRMKRLQLARLVAQLAALPEACTAGLRMRAAEALEAVEAQLRACPPEGQPSAEAAQAFAHTLLNTRDAALTTPAPLLGLFPAALQAAPDDQVRLALCVARAGLVAHGLSLAHTQVRLNAAQLHNAARLRFPALGGGPEDPARRRALFTAINTALEEVRAEPVDTGGLMAARASAARLMMTVAQITKHIDASQPIRFLIAETESGFTLLAALLLAKLSGVEEHIEISPLFETAEALEQRGERVVEEALRSPHFRAYLRRVGRLCLQFGYSDSGRYIGQIAATHLIERLKLRVADLLERYELRGLEVVLFDTHGEGLGRGGHADGLAERFDYLDPPAVRAAFARHGIPTRLETAFQGGDGYLLFGTPALAQATVARIAEHAFAPLPDDKPDPVYAEGGFATDLFAGARAAFNGLVEDPGYAAMLGAFGPALLDRTGSRPANRQSDQGGPAAIRHPRELRAIPNNAVLQQLGFPANLMHGLGRGAAREPEAFQELLEHSPRFSNALAFARAGLKLSDAEVLRGYVASLDPGTWLDRAAKTSRPGRAAALLAVARALEELALGDAARGVFRRLRADDLMLRAAWPGQAPRMSDRLFALHALRLFLIHRIWLVAVSVPDFSPRHGITREDLVRRLLRLDVEAAVEHLDQVFPTTPPPEESLDFYEAPSPRHGGYGREQEEIIEPLRAMFSLVREISAVVSLDCGAFG